MTDVGDRHAPRRRAAIKALLGLALVVSGHRSAYAKQELRAIAAGDSPAVRQIVDALRARFPGVQVSQDAKALSAKRTAGVHLALGPTALQAALASDLAGPIVGLFVSRQTYERLLGSAPRAVRDRATAIYAEASPDAHMQLIAHLFQRRVSVGALLSLSTQGLEADLRRAAKRADLALQLRVVLDETAVVREVASLSAQDVLLATPDATLYNTETLPAVLESTYRRNQPVIGFSPALVTAGTLAAAYAAVEDVLATLDLVLSDLEVGRLPDPVYPRFWRVAVNETVARSLNVLVSDEARALGSRPPTRSR